MKSLITSLIAAAFILSVPAPAAAASPYDLFYSYPDGWPKWIDRLKEKYGYEFEAGKTAINPHYLPLSLIRTGRFNAMVEEVSATKGLSHHDWPSWVGELYNQQ